jgi:hypothetical protein
LVFLTRYLPEVLLVGGPGDISGHTPQSLSFHCSKDEFFLQICGSLTKPTLFFFWEIVSGAAWLLTVPDITRNWTTTYHMLLCVFSLKNVPLSFKRCIFKGAFKDLQKISFAMEISPTYVFMGLLHEHGCFQQTFQILEGLF